METPFLTRELARNPTGSSPDRYGKERLMEILVR
jgi:hypothetical protein